MKAVLSGVANPVVTATTSTAGVVRGLRGVGAGWAPPASSSSTTPRAWSRSRGSSRASSTSSRAASARPASSAPARSPTRLERCEAGRRRPTTSTTIAHWLHGHRRQPLLPRRAGAGRRGASCARSRTSSPSTSRGRCPRPAGSRAEAGRPRRRHRHATTSALAQAARLDLRPRGGPELSLTPPSGRTGGDGLVRDGLTQRLVSVAIAFCVRKETVDAQFAHTE